MSHPPAPEQLPIPCQRCGASMTPTVRDVDYGNTVSLSCHFCGASETLRDEDRVRVAQERVAMLRFAQDAADAQARGADQIIAMRPWLGGVLVGGIMLLNGINTMSSTVAALQQTGAGMSSDARFSQLLSACMYAPMGVGIAAGMFGGWTLAMRRYRAAVEPERWARPPVTPDAPARCRCCGADLPMRWGAFVQCAYCNTQNLLDRALIDRRDALLVSETAMHQQRAAGVIARANKMSPAFGSWSMAGAALGGVAGALLGVVVAFVVSR